MHMLALILLDITEANETKDGGFSELQIKAYAQVIFVSSRLIKVIKRIMKI